MHGLLDDILLTVSTVSNKYRKELLQILLNGGGAGEMEEGMMWYALSHEQADEHEPWLNVQWRDQWLDRLERREYVSLMLSVSLSVDKFLLSQGADPDHTLLLEIVVTSSASQQ